MEDLLDTIRQKKAARSLSLRLWCYFEGLWVWLPWWRCSIRKTHWHYITALSKRRRRSISVIMITSVIMMLARDWSVITAAGFSVGPQLLSLVQCEAACELCNSLITTHREGLASLSLTVTNGTQRINSSLVHLNFQMQFLERERESSSGFERRSWLLVSSVFVVLWCACRREAAVCQVQGAQGMTGGRQQLAAC